MKYVLIALVMTLSACGRQTTVTAVPTCSVQQVKDNVTYYSCPDGSQILLYSNGTAIINK